MASETKAAKTFLDAPAHAPKAFANPMTRRTFLESAGATVACLASPLAGQAFASPHRNGSSGILTILPEDGPGIYLQAIDAAQQEIRIEICVLEYAVILEHIQAALQRGVAVRAIVDFRKYSGTPSERDHLEQYLTCAGGQLHLSNPVFPRSFPKIVLIDSGLVVYGSACLDHTTFERYRDFATTSDDQQILDDLSRLFENDWAYSAPPGQTAPVFNPTPPITSDPLIIGPVNGTERLVTLYQGARQTLDVYTELLGNTTLESELAAAVKRGVMVRLIAPWYVDGGTQTIQHRQLASLTALAALGVNVHVNGRETVGLPYMHARAAVVDGQTAYLGSFSLSPNATTVNREMGLIFREMDLLGQLQSQFESDYELRTQHF
jgi:cardiolipin synthase